MINTALDGFGLYLEPIGLRFLGHLPGLLLSVSLLLAACPHGCACCPVLAEALRSCPVVLRRLWAADWRWKEDVSLPASSCFSLIGILDTHTSSVSAARAKEECRK